MRQFYPVQLQTLQTRFLGVEPGDVLLRFRATEIILTRSAVSLLKPFRVPADALQQLFLLKLLLPVLHSQRPGLDLLLFPVLRVGSRIAAAALRAQLKHRCGRPVNKCAVMGNVEYRPRIIPHPLLQPD
ncbi:hypothetical protein D3C75_759450 [compost metagenome]